MRKLFSKINYLLNAVKCFHSLSLSFSVSMAHSKRRWEADTLVDFPPLIHKYIYICVLWWMILFNSLLLPFFIRIIWVLWFREQCGVVVWRGKKTLRFLFCGSCGDTEIRCGKLFYSWSHFFIQFFFVFFELLSIQRLPFLCTTAKLM